MAGCVKLETALKLGRDAAHYLCDYVLNCMPENSLDAKGHTFTGVENNILDALVDLYDAGVSFGFDGNWQNCQAAPSESLVILDPADRKVYLFDLTPCVK